MIGASAGTATWSGWVGLGELTGFGVVHPLPGIWDALTVNTAITLPIGVEAYAVYALSVATDARPLTRVARRWAWASAAGALLLGMAGQIAYHLLDSRHVEAAPWWVVALVSSLPVLVLGAASLLWHLAAVPVEPVEVVETGPGDVAAATGPDAGTGEAFPPVEVAPTPTVPPVPMVPLEPVVPAASAVRSPQPAGPAVPVDTLAPWGTRPPGNGAHRPARSAAAAAAARGAAAESTALVSAAGEDVAPPSGQDAAIVAELARATVLPTVREIKTTYRVGGSRAVRLRALALATAHDQPVQTHQPTYAAQRGSASGPTPAAADRRPADLTRQPAEEATPSPKSEQQEEFQESPQRVASTSPEEYAPELSEDVTRNHEGKGQERHTHATALP